MHKLELPDGWTWLSALLVAACAVLTLVTWDPVFGVIALLEYASVRLRALEGRVTKVERVAALARHRADVTFRAVLFGAARRHQTQSSAPSREPRA